MRWGEWESLTWTWEKSCKCNSPFAYPSAWISISLTLSLLSYSFTLQSDFICIYEYSFSAPSTNPPTHFVLRSPFTCVPLSLSLSFSYTLCELHELLISQLKKYDSGWWLVNILQRPQAEGLGTPKPGASWPRCLLVICRRQHIAFLSFKRFMRRAGQFPWLHCAKNRSLIKNNMLALT